jgi:uncharacterized cupredoxin-like copper-binding protein
VELELRAAEVGFGRALRPGPERRHLETLRSQAAHEAEMKDSRAMGGHGEEDEDAFTLEPGGSDELTPTFDQSGTVEIGCHQPGHYEAGMRLFVTVT